MSSFDLYCATCGAANAHTATTCFACGKSLSPTAEEDEASLSQQTLLNNRYRILSLVGQGGFAKVYRAEDTSDAKIVVIKAISLKALTPQEIIDATDTYNREIHFGTTLKHSSLPQIYAYFMDRDHWYIVADFIEGETLEEYMLRQPDKRLSLQEVLSIGIQVCSVLSYLHAHQPPIIFRDVKPDNIMRTPKGHIYLIDFGIARRLRPGQRRDTQTLGSPGYAAPEQYGSAQTTERSDIYSLGATLRALLTGKNPLDVPVSSIEDDLVAGIQVPSEFTALLSRMLETDPAKRYENSEVVKHQLEYIMKHSNIVLLDAKEALTQTKPFQPVAPSPSAASGVRSTPMPASQRHIWQKVLVTSLALLVIWGGIGSGAFNSISSFVQQNLLSLPIVSSPGQPMKVPADKQVFTFALTNVGSEILDPASAIDTPSIQAVRMLYSGLIALDDTMNVRPQLAASWQQSADGLTWTFMLRPNLRFSDGIPLTSADVAYSLDRALDPAVNSPTASSYLHSIADVDKRIDGKIPTLIGDSILTPDPSTLVIKTSSKIGFFLYALTCTCASVVEKALIDKYGSHFIDHLSEGGSSGPFKFEHQTAAGNMDFIVNPDYYGPIPQVTKVSFLVYSDNSSAYQAYLAGQATTVDVPQEETDTASVRSDFHKVPQLWVDYYAMNYLVKPFDNVKIRQAFALALNKDLIAHAVWHNTVLATNHIIPQGQSGYNPALIGPAGVSSPMGDSGLALQLLQQGMREEGMNDIQQLPAVTLTYAASSPMVENEMVTVQQMWQSALGIKVNLQKLSIANLLSKEAGSMNNPQGLQLWRLGYSADYPDPQDWTTLQFGQGSSLNTVNYGQNSSSGAEQQAVQQQLQVADTTSDQNERMQAYGQAEQQLVNDVAWLPMYQVEKSYLLKTDVRGYRMNALDIIPADDWANIYIVQ